MAIIVRGATCSFGEAVVDKLLSMDVDVIAIEESHKLRNETLLKYSQAKLLSDGEGYCCISCIKKFRNDCARGSELVLVTVVILLFSFTVA